MMNKILLILISFTPSLSIAASPAENLDLTNHLAGYIALTLFVLAYIFVMLEEFTHLRKSKPVILAAGFIWAIIGWVYAVNGIPHAAEVAVRHNFLEFAELFLFLLVAMTYIESMRERLVFDKLKVWLISKNFSYRQLFWLTGVIAFFMSPIADNLTTALVMGAVVLAVGAGNARFISIGFVNIVVAANAGGAFSPFGDITTLMVWQKGLVDFQQFFVLFLPSAVNYLIPAGIMHFAIKNEKPKAINETVDIKRGGIVITFLFFENEKDKILNKIFIARGGSLNFEVILSISDFATFLPSLNKVIIFFIIKISNRCELIQFHQINYDMSIF